ncbi:hypothetical protein ABHN84_20555 [Shewanella vesiculosa]|uniref:Uncharacterized protein n=1 Tax=Shewanella vesiculosa TaxID=518738 RepID=A0ABV0FUZ9_9GAMM
MDLRDKKKQFLDTLSLENGNLKAVSLGIDCLIDNEACDEDIPIVVTCLSDSERHVILSALETFCNSQYPDNKYLFRPSMLHITAQTSEQASIILIKKIRMNPRMLYWADSISWFKNLPDGLFHVISIERNSASRGLNKKGKRPEPILREYDEDSLLSELFVNINHKNINDIKNSDIASNILYDEVSAGLIRAIPAPKGMSFDETITINSPDWQKLACVAIRRYQSQECGDGMSWDISNDGWRDVIAYPFLEDLPTLDGSEIKQCLVGLVTMIVQAPKSSYLSTVWIHPFFRRKQKLTSLWDTLKFEYGEFPIEDPNSNMRGFLKSVNHLVE